MASDRELLDRAAKAAGVQSSYDDGGQFFIRPGCDFQEWDPLTDDGDALRLAAKLAMSIDVDEYETSTYAYAGKSPRVYAWELWGNNRDAATRRAIVRAAAALGEQTKEGE